MTRGFRANPTNSSPKKSGKTPKTPVDLRSDGKVKCPICGRVVGLNSQRNRLEAHLGDTTGRYCSMVGKVVKVRRRSPAGNSKHAKETSKKTKRRETHLDSSELHQSRDNMLDSFENLFNRMHDNKPKYSPKRKTKNYNKHFVRVFLGGSPGSGKRS